MTVWALLAECAGQLDEPFRRSEIMGWFRRHHPEVNEATLAAHIQAATANAVNRAQNNALGSRPPLLRRVDRGLYARADRPPAATSPQPGAARTLREPETPGKPGTPEEPGTPGLRAADIVLIGCVATKRAAACAAADLFDSPLFRGRRRHAAASGLPWYILSAKFGLLDPADVIGPYDVYLASQSPAYKKAWGEFVTAQLAQRHPGLRGTLIEVHAGAAYVEPLQAPLAALGATLTVPLRHLPLGGQLNWYNTHHDPARAAAPPPSAEPAPPPGSPGPIALLDADQAGTPDSAGRAARLAALLSDPAQAVTPAELLARGPAGLQAPGLYSWHVDPDGAASLSRGLGLPLPPGLIYAGQAGATRWPSGKRSASTVWTRITDMHLAGSAEFSTFRRTLAAVLRPVLNMTSENDPQLSAWINTHLRVLAVPVSDAGQLGTIETAVLDLLDPPLNLAGRPSSPIRQRLTTLRRDRTTAPGSAS